MNTLKIITEDREYLTWNVLNVYSLEEIKVNINPFEEKLFNHDHFEMCDDNIKLIHSSLRSTINIPGVLLLVGNKTYGKTKNKNLYKCVPDDYRIPSFLIPYEIKNMGFSKVFKNIYISFSFVHWDDKHPIGKIDQVIGDVDVLDNFYEYQLYCKSLNASIQKFHKATTNAIKKHVNSHDSIFETIKKNYPEVEVRTNPKEWYIFSIDPINSVDFDDAFSIKPLTSETNLISIYISNVSMLLDVLKLWDSFSQRVSTIYLPDKKRPMLPTMLSDCLCSLQEGKTRIAFVMDITITNNKIENVTYTNACIEVSKNYRYEESSLLKNHHYIILYSIIKDYSFTEPYGNPLKDSHDLVSYLMILMNHYVAKKLKDNNCGIFRCNVLKNDTNDVDKDISKDKSNSEPVPDTVTNFIKIWTSSASQYTTFDNISSNDTSHYFLKLDAYVHITSPIRRLVDLLNMIIFQKNVTMTKLSDDAIIFYNYWCDKIDYINITGRAIRKVQVDCSLLDHCFNNPSVLENIYSGYFFDKLEKSDSLFQYMVYIPEIKMTSRIICRDSYRNYEMKSIKLYVFKNENKYKKKIRIHVL